MKISKIYQINFLKLNKENYFIISAHRAENIDSKLNFKNFLDSLIALVNYYDKKIIVSTHPRTMKKLEDSGNLDLNKNILFLKPMGFFDYINLQKNSLNEYNIVLVSDTGTKTNDLNDDIRDIKNETKYLRDNYSVLFAIKNKDTRFKIYNEFVSSQELFSRYFNPNYIGTLDKIKRKIHDDKTNQFIEISNFIKGKEQI